MLHLLKQLYQTMCRFDMAPKSTNEAIGSNTVRIATTGKTKRGFTVNLCALASGHKKPAIICLKEKNGVILPRVSQTLRIPNNVRLTDGHMDQSGLGAKY